MNLLNAKLSDTRKVRPGLEELLKTLPSGDKVVVYKLDRISRSTKYIDTSTKIGKFPFRTMASIAELEWDITNERTKAGLQAARSREKKDGRPNKMEDKVAISIKMYKSMDYTMKEITETTGISKTTLYRYLNRAATLWLGHAGRYEEY